MKILMLAVSGLCLFLLPSTSFATTDINSPQFQSIVRQLDMQGHSDHDFSTCTVKHVYFDEVSDMLERDMGKEEILDYYVDQYGQAALKEPRAEGTGLVAWIGPGVGLLLAAIGGTSIIRSVVKQNRRNIRKDNSLTTYEEKVYDSLIEEERKKLF